MVANSRTLVRRAIFAGFVVAAAACANDLTAPSTIPGSASLSKSETPKPPVVVGPTLPVAARAFVDNKGNVTFEVTTSGNFDDPTIPEGQITYAHFRFCPVKPAPCRPVDGDDAKGHDYDHDKTADHDYYRKYDGDHGRDYDATYDSVAKAAGVKQFSANFHYRWPATEPSRDKDFDDDDQGDTFPQWAFVGGKLLFTGVQWDRLNAYKAIQPGGYTAFRFSGMPENSSVEIRVRYRMKNPAYVPPPPPTPGKYNGSKYGSSKGDDDDYKYNPQYLYRTVEICVPIKRAPNPSLATIAGFAALRGPLSAHSGETVTFTAYVSDVYGTANVRGTCQFSVDGHPVLPTVPVVVITEPGVGGTGSCSIPLSFTTGTHTVSVTVVGIYPADYDVADNGTSRNILIGGPMPGGGGGDNCGVTPCPPPPPPSPYDPVFAAFDATNLVQKVNDQSPVTITSYTDPNVPTDYIRTLPNGERPPAQGATVVITFEQELIGPFTISVSASTDGSPLTSFVNSGVTPAPLNDGTDKQCSTDLSGDYPQSAFICTSHSDNKTILTFSVRADLIDGSGHFVPYGRTFAFDIEVVNAAGFHYRLNRIANPVNLNPTNSGLTPVCTRNPTPTISATCSFTKATIIKPDIASASGSGILVYPTDH